MKFKIDRQIFDQFPELFVYIPVIIGFDNTKSRDESLTFLRHAEDNLRTSYSLDMLKQDPRIKVHFDGFRKFGVDPEKFKPAHYALAHRVLEGNPLPDINPMTNLYNAMSIAHLTPFGGEDLSTLYGDFVLSYAQGNEQWIPIGGGKAKPAVKGELVWGDDHDLSTRSLNWRQCERTKLTDVSHDGYFVMDGFVTEHRDNVSKAAQEFVDHATQLLGGTASIYVLDKDHPEVEIPYVTRVWKNGRIFVTEEQHTQSKKKSKQVMTDNQIFQIPADSTRSALNSILKKAAETNGWLSEPVLDFDVTHPKDDAHGDYTTNVALILAKKLGQNPREIAQKLVTNLQNDIQNDSMIEKVEVAGPGFINFTVQPSALVTHIDELVADTWQKPFSGKKISVEYTDPNPFKEFHLGHLYSNLIGESIARLYEASGATVWRADFYGDVGMHIAKSVWGMMQKMASEHVTLADLDTKPVKERQNYMGQGYAMGVIKYDEDEKIKEEIKDINYMVYVASQEVLVKDKGWKPLVDYKKYIEGHEEEYTKVRDVYQAGLKWSLAYFETYYARLGTTFDGYYPESWVGELGLQEVEKGLQKGVLTIGKEGAVVFEGEKYGKHTRVFRNALGLPTYEAKDLGLVQAKYRDFPFDYSLNIFGKEIDEYYKVVKTAMELIDPEKGKKQEHLAHGMVNLPTGKMSSRYGNVITVEWLLNEARDQAKKLIKNDTLSEAQKDAIAEQVGQAAVKYALLKSNVGDNVTFDFGQSVTFEGTSGPYLQYTYARALSVIRKASDIKKSDTSLPHGILAHLSRFDEVVTQAALHKSPSTLAVYLYDLAQRFNSFYNGNKIGDDEQRLWLTRAVSQILKKGLWILGIQSPEEM